MLSDDRRRHNRLRIHYDVKINNGRPYDGGNLYDLSDSGVAIMYPPKIAPVGTPLAIGQEQTLVIGGAVVFKGRIARIFEGGFATEFDVSMASAGI